MKTKTKLIAVFLPAFLASCAQIQSAKDLFNSTEALYSAATGNMEYYNGPEMCAAWKSNPVTAKDKYEGKSRAATGNILKIISENIYGKETRALALQTKTGKVTVILSDFEELGVRNIKVGQTITVFGRVYVSDEGKSGCSFVLSNASIIENPKSNKK
ncbi:MAG: hypothetical protein LWW76_02845 [Burkholderiales bacterium]|nr:hypothetical protein [Burkholderiales bacterium]